MRYVKDLLRNKNFLANEQRQTLLASSANRDDFLRSINTKVTIKRPTQAEFDRTLQLTNKTNQFNLTTKRITQVEFAQFQSAQNKDMFVAYVSDAFGAYGLTAVMYVDYNDTHVHIDNWLMSCRVFKRGIERALMNFLIKRSWHPSVYHNRNYR